MAYQATAAQLNPSGLTGSFSKVKVSVQVMLGSTRITLAELLNLKTGSAINLDQKLGESVTVIVNNCAIAKGELYVLEQDENRLGVKIIEMIPATGLTSESGGDN